MGHEGQDLLIKDALVFLFAAGIVVPFARRARVPAIVGFLLAGVALGPSGLGALVAQWPGLQYITMSDPGAVAPFAELGVLFLLFLLGLELSFEKLWRLRSVVFGAGALQVGLSASAIAGVAMALGLDGPGAITVGLALALSSTAIVMQILIDEHRAAGPVGRTALGVLLFQDILVAPILIYVGFISQDSDASLAVAVLEALLQGGLAVLVIVLIGRYLLRHIFRVAAHAGGRDFLMALTLFAIVGGAALTAGAGLSPALGAFLVGLLLGETEFKHQAEVDLDPFKGILLGLFFMSVGMGLNIQAIGANLPLILAGLASLVAAKAIFTFLACRLATRATMRSAEAAGLLSSSGEFAFVILAAATAGGVLTAQQATPIAAIAGMSMLLIPVLGAVGQWAGRQAEPNQADPPSLNDDSETSGHIIIAGFGRVGRMIADILDTENADLIALDNNPGRVARARDRGWKVYLGDGARPEILARAGAQGASLFIITVDDPAAAESMVRAVRSLRRDAPILARAQDTDHASALKAAGATHVIPDAIEAGLQLAGHALREFGYEGETVRHRIASERDDAYQTAEQGNKEPAP